MITNKQILLFLHNDSWFVPSKSDDKEAITDNDGNIIEVSKSYYHRINEGCKIQIRVSNHGTYMNTWVKHRYDPSLSLQNLSVVFSNGPITYKKITEPQEIKNEDGSISKGYTYFVIEQYVYKLDNLSIKDFKRVINQIKRLNETNVFTDPLRQKVSKKANRTPLTPNDIENNPIPRTNNHIHPRQTVVIDNPNYEVDAHGEILKYESLKHHKKNMPKRTIKINESILNEDIVGDILQESFFPFSEKVLMVKKFLDNGFARQLQDDIDANGYPKKKCVVTMLSTDKQPLKTMSMRELLLMLDDKFNSMVKDEKDRRAFLKQIIRDWFDKKISKQGLLSVNII